MEEAKHLLALNRSLVSVLLDWTAGLGRLEGWFGLDILDQLVIAGYG